MIYLNNAFTSFPKPPEVIEFVNKVIREPHLSAGRSAIEQDEEEDIVLGCRKCLAKLFNVENYNNISFTSGATFSLNMAIKGLRLENCHVITSAMEHTSVLRPLKLLEKNKVIELTIVDCDENGVVSPQNIEKAIRPNTKAIVLNHASNVVPAVNNIRRIGDITSEENITFIVDASQSAGCVLIDVKKMGIDVLAFTGHKSLFGLEGIGGIYIRDGIYIDPLTVGGTGLKSESLYQVEERPSYYESGTRNTVGIASLKAGVSYILNCGMDIMNEKKRKTFETLISGLREIPNVQLYGSHQYGTPLICFNIIGMLPTAVGRLLWENYSITVRTGLLCAPLIHEKIGTAPHGAVRISFSYFTTDDEIDLFLKAVSEIVELLNSGRIEESNKNKSLVCY